MLRVWACRLLVTGAIASLVLPSSQLPWWGVIALAPWAIVPALVVGHLAAWCGVGLALLLLWRSRWTPGSIHLATLLAAFVLAYGLWTADWRQSLPHAVASALIWAPVILGAVHFVWFWAEFPRVVRPIAVYRAARRSETGVPRYDFKVLSFGLWRGGSRLNRGPTFDPFLRRKVERGQFWLLSRALPKTGAIALGGSAFLFVSLFAGLDDLTAVVGFYLLSYLVGLGGYLATVSAGTASPEEQRQVLWFIEGAWTGMMVVGVGTPFVIATTLFGRPALYGVVPLAVALGALVIVASIGIGIFFSGAFDPILVIRRTTLVGIGTVAFTFAFAGLESLAEGWLVNAVGLPEGSGTWIAAGVLALLFEPARALFIKTLSPAQVSDDAGAA